MSNYFGPHCFKRHACDLYKHKEQVYNYFINLSTFGGCEFFVFLFAGGGVQNQSAASKVIQENFKN